MKIFDSYFSKIYLILLLSTLVGCGGGGESALDNNLNGSQAQSTVPLPDNLSEAGADQPECWYHGAGLAIAGRAFCRIKSSAVHFATVCWFGHT